MGFYLSPLVKVKEIDASNTVPAVATSIGVIALRNAYKGPSFKPTLVTSESDLVYMFGEPTDVCYKDWLSAAGYLKYGNKLYVSRVLDDTSTFAQVTIGITGTTGTSSINDDVGGSITTANLDMDDPDSFGDLASIPADKDLFFLATSRGEWAGTTGNEDGIRLAFLDRATQYQIGLKSGMSGYITGTNDGPYAQFAALDSRISYNPTGVVSGDLSNGIAFPTAPSKDFLVLVQEKGQKGSTFITKESFLVSTDVDARNDQGESLFIKNVINEKSNLVRVAINRSLEGTIIPSGTGLTGDTWFYLTGGVGTDTSVSDGNIIEAYNIYSNPEEIDVNIFIDSDKSNTVKSELIVIAESRMDCIAILDVLKDDIYNQKGNETTNLLTWVNNEFNQNTSYASTYANWIEVYDKYNQKYRWIPSSGYMAGIYAHTDDVNEPWGAPAGLNRAILTGVRRLAWNPSLGNRDILYSNKLNPIVSFSGQGKVVWGQKTLLSKESAFNRVNVRRLFIVLEKAISTACKYFIFEPNDPATRNLLINMITPFLRDVKGRRGIYEFMVVADETVNTPERVDRNELWVNIYIKPTRTAEFIVLNFIATKTGASFTELAGNV